MKNNFIGYGKIINSIDIPKSSTFVPKAKAISKEILKNNSDQFLWDISLSKIEKDFGLFADKPSIYKFSSSLDITIDISTNKVIINKITNTLKYYFDFHGPYESKEFIKYLMRHYITISESSLDIKDKILLQRWLDA